MKRGLPLKRRDFDIEYGYNSHRYSEFVATFR